MSINIERAIFNLMNVNSGQQPCIVLDSSSDESDGTCSMNGNASTEVHVVVNGSANHANRVIRIPSPASSPREAFSAMIDLTEESPLSSDDGSTMWINDGDHHDARQPLPMTTNSIRSSTRPAQYSPSFIQASQSSITYCCISSNTYRSSQ